MLRSFNCLTDVHLIWIEVLFGSRLERYKLKVLQLTHKAVCKFVFVILLFCIEACHIDIDTVLLGDMLELRNMFAYWNDGSLRIAH